MECCLFFFFNDTATTEIYTLSLHDALPICLRAVGGQLRLRRIIIDDIRAAEARGDFDHATKLKLILRHFGRDHPRSEEHTSELQSRQYLVCRLLLEKKKKQRFTLRYSMQP